MSRTVRGGTSGINGLAALAGIIYGAFLGGAFFGGSWMILGAVVGLVVLSPAIAQMVLVTAGILMGISGIGSPWSEHHEHRARRIAKVLLVIVIVSGAFGLFFTPVK